MPKLTRFSLALLFSSLLAAGFLFHGEWADGNTRPDALHGTKAKTSSAQNPTSAGSSAVAASSNASTADASANSASPVPLLRTEQEFCALAHKRLPNVSLELCAQDQLVDSGARSVLGRPLWARDVIAPDAKRRVLIIGGIHGDELSASALALNWIRNAQIAPNRIHWRFVPLMNPDGALREPPTRMNARGVDLNRNFPTPNWDAEAPVYWAKRTGKDPRRYPGPKSLSEPETRWLVEEIARWKPDLIVSIHAPYGVLDFDGPVTPPQRLGRLYLDQVGIYPGSLGNYGGVLKKVPVVTIELQSAIRTPLDPEMRQMWLDLLHWIDERLGPA